MRDAGRRILLVSQARSRFPEPDRAFAVIPADAGIERIALVPLEGGCAFMRVVQVVVVVLRAETSDALAGSKSISPAGLFGGEPVSAMALLLSPEPGRKAAATSRIDGPRSLESVLLPARQHEL